MATQVSKTVTSREVAARLKRGENLYVLDVRESGEWAGGHIASAKHIPLGELLARRNELDPSREIVIVCRSGSRSGLACELLRAQGFRVVNMVGGLMAWPDELVRG